jgi:hypothetical protein
MKTNVFYTIRKEDAIKAGKNQWGQFSVELDPSEVPEVARAELAGRADDSKYSDLAEGLGLAEPITIERAVELLVQCAAERATKEAAQAARKTKEKADDERRHAERVEELAARIRERAAWTDRDLNQMFYNDLYHYRGDLPEDVKEILTKNAVAYAAHQETERVRKENEKAIVKAQEERIDEIRTELLCVALTGKDAARYRAKLLPVDEQTQRRNDFIFSQFGFPKYGKITKSDIEHKEDYCEGEIDFEIGTPTDGITVIEFEEFEEIKNTAGEQRLASFDVVYVAVLEEHVGTCNACEAATKRLAVRVEARVEDLVIASRLFAL